MLQDDIRIVRIEPRLFHRSLRDEMCVFDEILVNRRILCDIDDNGTITFTSYAASLLPE